MRNGQIINIVQVRLQQRRTFVEHRPFGFFAEIKIFQLSGQSSRVERLATAFAQTDNQGTHIRAGERTGIGNHGKRMPCRKTLLVNLRYPEMAANRRKRKPYMEGTHQQIGPRTCRIDHNRGFDAFTVSQPDTADAAAFNHNLFHLTIRAKRHAQTGSRLGITRTKQRRIDKRIGGHIKRHIHRFRVYPRKQRLHPVFRNALVGDAETGSDLFQGFQPFQRGFGRSDGDTSALLEFQRLAQQRFYLIYAIIRFLHQFHQGRFGPGTCQQASRTR